MAKPKSKLVGIAAEMRRQAIAQPYQPIAKTLKGGLRLRLIYKLSSWQLSAIREGKPPSLNEIKVLRRDFGIPDTAREEANRQSVQGVEFHVRRLIWAADPQQLNFLEQETAAVAVTSHHYQEE